MEVTGQLCMPTTLPEQSTLVLTGREAEWSPQPVCIRWRKKLSPAPFRNQTPDNPAHSLITIPTELSQHAGAVAIMEYKPSES